MFYLLQCFCIYICIRKATVIYMLLYTQEEIIMELKTLRALTLKHINLSINMLNNPGLFNTSDSSFNILIEEQIFITLAFVGSF